MMGNDWLTDELMQRARKLIEDIDGSVSKGTVYTVSRALHLAEKRGEERAALKAEKWAGDLDPFLSPNAIPILREFAEAIRSGS